MYLLLGLLIFSVKTLWNRAQVQILTCSTFHFKWHSEIEHFDGQNRQLIVTFSFITTRIITANIYIYIINWSWRQILDIETILNLSLFFFFFFWKKYSHIKMVTPHFSQEERKLYQAWAVKTASDLHTIFLNHTSPYAHKHYDTRFPEKSNLQQAKTNIHSWFCAGNPPPPPPHTQRS